MRIRRDILIQSILKHQRSFFKILDYINENSGVLEIPSSIYLNIYHKEICPKAMAQNDINIQTHLSVESLVENGIFVYYNKHTGNLSIANQVYELLRFIDVSRARELNREDFANLRAHIEQTVNNVMQYEVGTEQYHDAMTAFHSVINETLSKFRSNVEKLVIKVEDIAIEYKDFEENKNASFIELYEKVRHLYQKYVLPCYDFVSPSIQLISRKSFSESLNSLIEFHQEMGNESVANQIGFNKTAVTSYFKDVSELENKLKQYSNRLETDRRFFMSVESAYSCLMENINELRHGKKRGFLLSETAQFFSNYKSLDGLSSHNLQYDSDLQWEREVSIKRFTEYLKGLDDLELCDSANQAKDLKPLPINIDPDKHRKIVIARIVNEIDSGCFKKNIHTYLSEELENCLDDYSLVDVLFGLECVHSLYNQDIVMTGYRHERLTDDRYFLDYLPIKVMEFSNV